MRKQKMTAMLVALLLASGLFVSCQGPDKPTPTETTKAGEEQTTAAEENKEAAASTGETQAEEETKAGEETKAAEETKAGEEAKAPAEGEVDKIDWKDYDALIKSIKAEADPAKRADLMHQAETMLMETGAIVPLYHYNDSYMMKPELKDVTITPLGFKYFGQASMGDKKELNLNMGSEPETVDPQMNSSVDGACLSVNSFAGLYTYDKDNKLIPDLCAKEAEVSDDKLTYTFTLREGLKWSDGEKLDANDIAYAWKRGADPATTADYQYMFDVIDGYPSNLNIQVSEDGLTLTVKLSAPCPYFLELTAFPTYFPVPQKAIESAEGYMKDGKVVNPKAWTLKGKYPSNGPFMIDSWNHESSIVYVKNPNYHRADEVKFDKLTFMLSDDNPAIFSAYESGSLDFIDSVPTNELSELKKREDFHVADQIGTYFVIFNTNSKELFGGKTKEQAIALRKALGCCLDRQYIIDNVAQTGQHVATSFIPDSMMDGNGKKFHDDGFAYPVDGGYMPAQPDLDMARKYLEEAGFKLVDGKLSPETPLNLTYIANDIESHVRIGEIIQSDYQELGINMEIKTMAWNNFQSERKAGNFGIARHGWIADFSDPINMLEMWTSDSGNNDAQLGK